MPEKKLFDPTPYLLNPPEKNIAPESSGIVDSGEEYRDLQQQASQVRQPSGKTLFDPTPYLSTTAASRPSGGKEYVAPFLSSLAYGAAKGAKFFVDTGIKAVTGIAQAGARIQDLITSSTGVDWRGYYRWLYPEAKTEEEAINKWRSDLLAGNNKAFYALGKALYETKQRHPSHVKWDMDTWLGQFIGEAPGQVGAFGMKLAGGAPFVGMSEAQLKEKGYTQTGSPTNELYEIAKEGGLTYGAGKAFEKIGDVNLRRVGRMVTQGGVLGTQAAIDTTMRAAEEGRLPTGKELWQSAGPAFAGGALFGVVSRGQPGARTLREALGIGKKKVAAEAEPTAVDFNVLNLTEPELRVLSEIQAETQGTTSREIMWQQLLDKNGKPSKKMRTTVAGKPEDTFSITLLLNVMKRDPKTGEPIKNKDGNIETEVYEHSIDIGDQIYGNNLTSSIPQPAFIAKYLKEKYPSGIIRITRSGPSSKGDWKEAEPHTGEGWSYTEDVPIPTISVKYGNKGKQKGKVVKVTGLKQGVSENIPGLKYQNGVLMMGMEPNVNGVFTHWVAVPMKSGRLRTESYLGETIETPIRDVTPGIPPPELGGFDIVPGQGIESGAFRPATKLPSKGGPKAIPPPPPAPVARAEERLPTPTGAKYPESMLVPLPEGKGALVSPERAGKTPVTKPGEPPPQQQKPPPAPPGTELYHPDIIAALTGAKKPTGKRYDVDPVTGLPNLVSIGKAAVRKSFTQVGKYLEFLNKKGIVDYTKATIDDVREFFNTTLKGASVKERANSKANIGKIYKYKPDGVVSVRPDIVSAMYDKKTGIKVSESAPKIQHHKQLDKTNYELFRKITPVDDLYKIVHFLLNTGARSSDIVRTRHGRAGERGPLPGLLAGNVKIEKDQNGIITKAYITYVRKSSGVPITTEVEVPAFIANIINKYYVGVREEWNKRIKNNEKIEKDGWKTQRLLPIADENALNGIAREIQTEAGIPVRDQAATHGLRANYANRMFDEGLNPSQIAKKMGHTVNELLKSYLNIAQKNPPPETLNSLLPMKSNKIDSPSERVKPAEEKGLIPTLLNEAKSLAERSTDPVLNTKLNDGERLDLIRKYGLRVMDRYGDLTGTEMYQLLKKATKGADVDVWQRTYEPQIRYLAGEGEKLPATDKAPSLKTKKPSGGSTGGSPVDYEKMSTGVYRDTESGIAFAIRQARSPSGGPGPYLFEFYMPGDKSKATVFKVKGLEDDIRDFIRKGLSEFKKRNQMSGTEEDVFNIIKDNTPKNGTPTAGGGGAGTTAPISFLGTGAIDQWIQTLKGSSLEEKAAHAKKLAQSVTNPFWDGLARKLYPQGKVIDPSESGNIAKELLREQIGSKDRFYAFIEHIFSDKKITEVMDKLDSNAQINFLQYNETRPGSPGWNAAVSKGTVTPEQVKVMKIINWLNDYVVKEVEKHLGPGDVFDPRIYYAPHIFKNLRRAQEAWRDTGKIKTLYDKGFMKRRFFEDIYTALENKAELVTTNPIELYSLRWYGMLKYASLMEAIEGLRKTADVVDVPRGGMVPQGYEKVARFDKYAFSPGAAAVIKNYLSHTLWTREGVGPFYSALQRMNHSMNMFQLGLGSVFHISFTGLEAQISTLSEGIQALSYAFSRPGHRMEEFGRAGSHIARGLLPISMFMKALNGRKMMAEYFNVGLETLGKDISELSPTQKMFRYMEMGGGGFAGGFRHGWRVTKHYETARAYWAQGNIPKALYHSIMIPAEATTRLIMDRWVPWMKAGTFSEMMGNWMERNPNATREQIRSEAGRIWNHVDARLGAVRYDRLFIDNAWKNLAQFLVRAPGWKAGTITEIAGSTIEAGRFARGVGEYFSGKSKEFPIIGRRMAYTLALGGFSIVMNGLLTKMFTDGDKITSQDYWSFRTGVKDEKGRDSRFLLPLYTKDVYAALNDPKHWMASSTSPILNWLTEIMRNRTYYGEEVYRKGQGVGAFAKDILGYTFGSDLGSIGGVYQPFWFRASQRLALREASGGAHLATAFGIMPASPVYSMSNAEKVAQDLSSRKLPAGPYLKETAEKRRDRQRMIWLARNGRRQEAMEIAKKWNMSVGTIHRTEKQAKTPYIFQMFETLDDAEASRVWDDATKEEKRILRQSFIKKLTTKRTLPKEIRDAYLQEARSIYQ